MSGAARILWGTALLGVTLAACYSPNLTDGFECDRPGQEPRCPSGFMCAADGKCYRQPPGSDSGLPIDGGTPIDGGGVVRAPPVHVGDGRHVAVATMQGGARLAVEDPPNVPAPTGAIIRYVDIDPNGNLLGSLAPLSGNLLKPRSQLRGEGDDIPAFAWIEGDSIDATRADLYAAAGGNNFLVSAQTGVTKGYPFDVVVSKGKAFLVWVDTGNTRLHARRIDSGGNTTVGDLTSAGAGNIIDELDAAMSADGDSIVVSWHEMTGGATTTPREDLRVGRWNSGTFSQVWNLSFDALTNLGAGRPLLRHPRVSLSSSASVIVLVGWENTATVMWRSVALASGTGLAASVEADLILPQVAALPGNGASGSLVSWMIAVKKPAVDVRGKLARRREPPQSMSDLGNKVAAPLIVTDGNDVIMAAQDGTDSGGTILAWSSAAGWPSDGLRLNGNPDAARPELALQRRLGGGSFIAWVENGAAEGQVYLQTLRADSSTPR